MQTKIGYPEYLLLFSAVLIFHNVTLALSCAGFSLFIAFCRFSLEYSEKAKKAEKAKEATELLNESAAELGEVLGTLFKAATPQSKSGNTTRKKKDKDDGTIH